MLSQGDNINPISLPMLYRVNITKLRIYVLKVTCTRNGIFDKIDISRLLVLDGN